MTLELLGIGSPYLVSPGPHKHKLWSLNLHSCRENDPSLSNLSSKLQLSNPGSILTNPLHHVQCSHTFPIMQWPDLDAFTTQVVAQVLFTQKEIVWPIESLLVLRAIQSVRILALLINSLTFPINSPPWSSHHPPTLGTIYSNQINLTSCTYLGSGRKTEQPGEAHVPRMCTQRAAEIRIEVTPTLHRVIQHGIRPSALLVHVNLDVPSTLGPPVHIWPFPSKSNLSKRYSFCLFLFTF